MADLEQSLDRLLSDPDAMAQIMDLAGRLRGPAPGPESAPEEPPEAPPVRVPEPDGLGPLLSLLRSGEGPDSDAEALVRALGPYLSEDRRRKLDRALRLTGLARTARGALGLWKEGTLSV